MGLYLWYGIVLVCVNVDLPRKVCWLLLAKDKTIKGGGIVRENKLDMFRFLNANFLSLILNRKVSLGKLIQHFEEISHATRNINTITFGV